MMQLNHQLCEYGKCIYSEPKSTDWAAIEYKLNANKNNDLENNQAFS